MPNQSIYSKILAELQQNKNHSFSFSRCREIMVSLEEILNKRIISYFASEIGEDFSSMVNDEDAFLIENLLSIKSDRKDLVLILHSNGGLALSAERIIEICRNYCKERKDGSDFIVVVPKKAKSAATIVALGANKIYLRNTAELGPVDPQFVFITQNGTTQIEPACSYVDALENLFKIKMSKNRSWKNIFKKNNNQPLSQAPKEIKLKLIEQCSYPLYVKSKNEIELSESIIEKISKKKIELNPDIKLDDFNIFKDPHIMKSHGRLINFSDLENNGLRREKIINKLEDLFDSQENYKKFDDLLFEFYVRRRQLFNDVANRSVKIIEGKDEFFVNLGVKRGQIKNPPKQEEFKNHNHHESNISQ